MNHHRTVAFFGPLTTRHLWFTVHIFHLPPFFCLLFLRVVVVILVHARWIHSLKNKRGQNVCVRVVNLAPRLTNPFFFFYHVTLEDNFKDFATVFHMRVQHFPSVPAQKQNPVISGCTQNENEHRWDWLEEM